MRRFSFSASLFLLMLCFTHDNALAQGPGGRGMAAAEPRVEGPFKELHWRQIGPFRGGRVLAVAGVTSQPQVYYFGATGGGIFKTSDGGATWIPVADGQIATG